MMKRILCFILALGLMVGCLPAQVFAAAAEHIYLAQAESQSLPDAQSLADDSSSQEPDAGIMPLSDTDDIAGQPENAGFAGGKGTETDPYRISSRDQLLWFAKKVNSGTSYDGKFILLTANITLNDTSDFNNWLYTAPSTYNSAEQSFPINNFGGTFDGGGYTITGLYIVQPDTSYLGFFGKTKQDSTVTIRNLTLHQAHVRSSNYRGLGIGALVGEATSLVLEKCSVNGIVKGGSLSSVVGGLVGRVTDSGFYSSAPAGLTMRNCYNYASVSGGESIGGLIADVSISGYYANRRLIIEDCQNFGEVKASDDYAGGIASHIIVGQQCDTFSITRCHNSGRVSAALSGAGGVFYNIRNEKAVRTVSQLSNSGSVSSRGTSGGVLGNIYAAENEYRYPNRLTLTDCYNNGSVFSSDSTAGTGGILGRGTTVYGSSIVLNNCFSTGDITGGTNCAILGKNEYIISGYDRQYSVAVNNCYYLDDSADNGCDISTATALNAIQMVRESTYAGFDFATTWKMSSHHPVFSWQTASVAPTISNSDIVRLVARYTSQDLYEQYEDIMYGDRFDSAEEKHRQLQYLFRYHGLTDVQEGISYLSDATGERRATLGLVTDELYTATNYRNWLTGSLSGGLFRAFLIADGLAFNNELNEWLSFPTYVEGNYPGVKKYKAMLYDFLDTAANEIEAQTYIKTLSDISSGLTGELKTQVDDLIETLNDANSIQAQRTLLKESSLWYNLAGSDVTGVVVEGDYGPKFNFRYTETSGLAQYAKAMDIVGTVVSLADASLSNFLSMQQLDARLKAYVQFEDFLETIRTDTENIPYEMRWAAELVMKEMEEGYGLAMRNLVVELFGATKLNDKVFSTIFTKLGAPDGFSSYLITINATSFFINCLVNLGETVQNVTFVEGYAAAAKTYRQKLLDAEQQFQQNPSEVNAWDFVYNYNMLYLLREKGELAYIDLADTEGLAQKMADNAYSANRAVAQQTLDLLRSDFRFDISGMSDVPESVQYLSKMTVDCPVDVHVYDPQGNLIITLQDGAESDVTNEHGRFAVLPDPFTGEYVKVLCFAQDLNYGIKIVGVDKGLVNVAVAVKDGTATKEYVFANEKIDENTVFTTTVEQIKTSQSYDIDTDGDAVTDSAGTLSAPADHTVHVTAVTITPASLTLCAGKSTVLGVEITPQNATNRTVAWFSSDESVATIKNGKLTAVGNGTATITAVSGDDHDIKAVCTVTVAGHSWTGGVCQNCGDACVHTGGTATCTDKAVCVTCNTAYGEVDAGNHTGTVVWTQSAEKHSSAYTCCSADVVAEENHHWLDGVCEECQYPCIHTGGTATCTAKAVCVTCNTAYGEVDADNHTGTVVWTQSAEKHSSARNCCGAGVIAEEGHHWLDGVCEECQYPCVHTGGTATCADKAVCDACGAAYGELRDSHADADNNNHCDDCGKRLKADSAAEEETKVHSHSWILTMVKDTTHHWYECSTCGAKDEYAPHSHGADGNCTVCGHYSPADVKEAVALPDDSAANADLPTEEDAASTGAEQPTSSADSESAPGTQEPESSENSAKPDAEATPESGAAALPAENTGSVYTVVAIGAAAAALVIVILIKSRKRKAD